jgi:hypothetical protein
MATTASAMPAKLMAMIGMFMFTSVSGCVAAEIECAKDLIAAPLIHASLVKADIQIGLLESLHSFHAIYPPGIVVMTFFGASCMRPVAQSWTFGRCLRCEVVVRFMADPY